MSSLNEHFKSVGYTFHKDAVRKQRLPQCCRENLKPTYIGIKYFSPGGEDVVLPVLKCSLCGRNFALFGERYIPADNLLKFDTVALK